MYQPRFLPHAIVLISFLATLSQGQTSFPVTLTLNPDEPITAGTSLLWSPSGQAAWDAMRMFHGVERLELVPPTPIADVLNDFQWDAASVLPAGTVVFGGEDSVARRAEIREELRKKVGPKAAAMIGPFRQPGFIAPDLERVKSALFVSCLSHAPKFPVSFLPDTEMQIFSCSNQRQVFTRGFGAQGKMAEEMGDALVVQADDLKGSFVLRLPFLKNENELPDALILAQKPGLKTLGEGIEWMRQSLKNPIPAVGVVEHQGRHWSYFHHLSSSDQFWMPKLNTTLACDYGELIGKTYLHQNHPETQTETFWFIMEAQQMLSFKLNETGAMTHNVFKVSPDFLSLGGMGGALPDGVKPEELPVWPKKFVLNGPFLAALWRKDAEWPYLVCWVDSDEVMELK